MASKRPPQCNVSEPEPTAQTRAPASLQTSNQAIQDQMNAPARASFASDGSWVRLWGFPVGQSAPQPAHQSALTIATQQYGERPITRITGHASPEGAETMNESLAYNRAAEVADVAGANAEVTLVTCGESPGVAEDQYPYYRAAQVEFGEGEQLCDPFPEIVQRTVNTAFIVRDKMIKAGHAYRTWRTAKYEHIRDVSAHRQAEHLGVLGFWAPNRGAVDEMQKTSKLANHRHDGTKRPEFERAVSWFALPFALCIAYTEGQWRTLREAPDTFFGPGAPPNGVYVDQLEQEYRFLRDDFEQERGGLELLIRSALEDGCVTKEQLDDILSAQLSSSAPNFK